MGRGRAKAKQVKVARQLKYSGGGMDLDRLRAEFGVSTDRQNADDHDPYADFANRYSVDDERDDDEYSDYGGDDFDDEEDLNEDIDDEDLDEAEGLEDDEDAGNPVREHPRAKGSAGARVSKANGS
jgi:hypothetical protein